MHLYLIDKNGKKVTLSPVAKTRSELRQLVKGDYFTLGGSDYKYSVEEVKASPSPDTSLGMFLFVFFFCIVITRSFVAAAVLGFIAWGIKHILFRMDKNSVDIFNNS